MDKKENLVLDEIKVDIKKILDILENPKKELSNEKQYNQNYPKKDFVLKDPNSPATTKQKEFLISKEYNGDVDILTKLEASKLIDEHINRREK